MSIIRAYPGLVVKKNGTTVLIGPDAINFTGLGLSVEADGTTLDMDAALSDVKDLASFRHIGSSPFSRYYIPGQIGSESLTSRAVVADTLYAVPHVEQRGGTIDTVSVYVSVSSPQNFRLGLYGATSQTNLYPNALIEDFGTLTISTTGFKTLTLASPRALTQNSVLWFVLVAVGTPTLSAVPATSLLPILGSSASVPTSPGVGLSVAFTYAALPSTFPSDATVIAAEALYAIFLHYSA